MIYIDRIKFLVGFLLLIFAIAASKVAAMEITKAEEIVNVYSRLRSYCDQRTIEESSNGMGTGDGAIVDKTELCVTNYGKFKRSRMLTFGTIQQWSNDWSDGRTLYQWEGNREKKTERITSYREQDLDQWLQHNRRKDLLVMTSLGTLSDGNDTNADSLLQRLRSFKENSKLSDATHIVFENRVAYDNEESKVGSRITVGRRDGLVRKYESFGRGPNYRTVKVTKLSPNPVLAPEDLEGKKRWFHGFTFDDHPFSYLALIAAFAPIAGWMFGVATVRSEGFDELVCTRQTLWRVFWIGLAGVGTILGILAALSMIGGGGGHPHPIIMVAILGLVAGCGFVAFALFLLASYFARPADHEDAR